MSSHNHSHRLLNWLAILSLAVVAGFGAIEATRISLEHSYKEVLATEVKRRAIEITAQTMNGNVMGAVSTMGLVNHPLKNDANGKEPSNNPMAMEPLEASSKAHQASGMFIIGSNGIVRSSWDSLGKPTTGLDLKFRTYFQIAMQGKQNIYAAVSMATGKRALFFAAPLYSEVSESAPVIGAVVARMGPEQIESILKAWPGPALLLSPQEVTFASNHDNWIEYLATTPTPERLQAIRALKQFGKVFESNAPKILPFDMTRDIVSFDNHRYSVARAAVQWNDPQGEWTLVLLGNLDELMPSSLRTLLFTTSSALVIALSAIFLAWRERLQRANHERERAEAELKAYTVKLESDSATKSYLAEVAADLHQAGTLTEFARKLMYHITPRLEVDYGAFYLWDEKNNLLTPIGGHGVLPNKLQAMTLGQGLVGQCANDRMPIDISDSGNTDIRIVWGNGKIAPKSIVMQPVVHVDRLLGVIVLASLQSMNTEKRALLDALMPMVAINLEVLERKING